MPYVTNLGWAGLAIMGVFGECFQTIIFSFQTIFYVFSHIFSHIFSLIYISTKNFK